MSPRTPGKDADGAEALPEWARIKIQKLEESVSALLQQIEAEAEKGPTTIRRRGVEEKEYIDSLLRGKRELEQEVLQVQTQLDVLREKTDPMPMLIARLERENADLQAQVDGLRVPVMVSGPHALAPGTPYPKASTPTHNGSATASVATTEDGDASLTSLGNRALRDRRERALLIERISLLETELRERDRESQASASPIAEKLHPHKYGYHSNTSSLTSRDVPKQRRPSSLDGRATRSRATSLSHRGHLDEHAMERLRFNLDNTISKVAIMLRQLSDTERRQQRSKSKSEGGLEHIPVQKKMLTGAYHDLAVSKQLLAELESPAMKSSRTSTRSSAAHSVRDAPLSQRGQSPRCPSTSRRSTKSNVPPLSINELRMSGRSPRVAAAASNTVLSPKQSAFAPRGASPAVIGGEPPRGKPDRKKGSSSKHLRPMSSRRSHPSTPTTPHDLPHNMSRQSMSTVC